jgi:hypothetical protein
MIRKVISTRRHFKHVFLILLSSFLSLLAGWDSPNRATGVSSAAEGAIVEFDTNGPVSPAQSGPVLPHKTDFLSGGCLTHTFAGLSSSARSSCLENIKSRGYTHFYLYAYNEKDYGGPSFNYYNNPRGFRSYLQEVIGKGLVPVVWLVPDDARAMRNRSTSEVKLMMSQLVPQIDDLVSSYVLGLELDEYWSKNKVDELGKHLNTLTNKNVAVHMTPGKWDFCHLSWCDYMVLQYGFGKSQLYIRNMTTQAKNDLGKPVVAGEYWKESEGIDGGKHLGDAGVLAGASGFGNGGTVILP